MPTVIARCSQGALFQTRWVWWGSLQAIRLGARRYQRCPVHQRWEIIRKADPDTLTPGDRAQAAEHPPGRLF